ncbi:MAG: secretin N-terminal domain-containing protein [bacterium]|jgi:type II secretory pathway component GspD/PulD (secretin)
MNKYRYRACHALRLSFVWALVMAVFSVGAQAQMADTAMPAVIAQIPSQKPHMISEYHLPGLEKKISLDLLESMDVVDLLKFLSVKAGLNIIIGKDVAGSSKLMIKDVTIADAMEIVLAANSLAYEIQGTIIKVMTDKEYRELYGEGFYERKKAKIISLKSSIPSQMAQLLEQVKSTMGKIVFDDSTGNLVLIDTPEKIREMEDVISKAELPSFQRAYPTVTTNFVLQYAVPEKIEPLVTPMLTKIKDASIGQLKIDARTKTLIVTDLPNVVQKIGDLIAMFDRPQKQVFIEAKIIQVQLSDSMTFGVNWDYLFQGLDPRFSLAPASRMIPGVDSASAVNAVGGSVTYHTIAAGADLNMIVKALSTVGKTKLLQNPHIAALDGKEAMIKAITTEPYSELQYETGSSNIVGKTYKFVEVGVTLGVTPHINELGFITCEIRPEVSSVLRWYDSDPSAGAQNSGVPVVKKSFAETSVSVKDGVTIIIAGMIDESQTKMRSQIPFLGSIPLLGVLFRYDDTKIVNSETIILLTPRIVTGDKFFERSRDMKKPVKGAIPSTGLTAAEFVQ